MSVTPAGTSNVRPQAVAAAAGTAKFAGATQSTVNLASSFYTASNRFTLSGGAFSVDAVVRRQDRHMERIKRRVLMSPGAI